MKNLEQNRASHALKACEKSFRTEKDADVTKKISTMVQECGLLPSLAFALENNDGAYKKVFTVFAGYMSGKEEVNPNDFLKELLKKDAAELRHTTSECLAYLSFLRRFANIKKGKNNGGN